MAGREHDADQREGRHWAQLLPAFAPLPLAVKDSLVDTDALRLWLTKQVEVYLGEPSSDWPESLDPSILLLYLSLPSSHAVCVCPCPYVPRILYAHMVDAHGDQKALDTLDLNM